MSRIFKFSKFALKLFVPHASMLTDMKLYIYTDNFDIAYVITSGFKINVNEVGIVIPQNAVSNMSDGVINYRIEGYLTGDFYMEQRQSNYYLKTPSFEIEDETIIAVSTEFVDGGDYKMIIKASEYNADGLSQVEIDATTFAEEKYEEGNVAGFETGKQIQKELMEPITITENGTYTREDGYNNIIVDVPQEGGDCNSYPTIKEIYNTEDTSTEVSFKGIVAVCLQYGSNYRTIVTDHTGAFYIDANQPYDVGDECIFTGAVRKTIGTNMRFMQRPVVEVLSKNNYVVMPTDAVELTNVNDLYIPNEYGNAEMKYLYYEGVVEKFNSNGNIRITAPESVSERGYINLLASKEEWRSDLVVGDYVRVYMFPASSNSSFIPTDFIKLGTGGESVDCPELIEITITENGVYEGAFNRVDVNVQSNKIDVAEAGIKFGNSTFNEVPEWADFSNVTTMQEMFYACYNLTTFPLINTISITDMSGMFRSCINLTSIPLIDTSNVTNMNNMFQDCTNLTSIPLIDTSNVTTMEEMFYWCTNLTTLPRLDVSNVTDMSSMFYFCNNLTNIGGFINLKVSIDISHSKKITRESVLNIFNDMAVVEVDNNKMIFLHTDVISQLSEEDIAIATQKGWSVRT